MPFIYMANEKAERKGWDWDSIFINSAIQVVKEFDTIEEAKVEFEKGGYDTDRYGIML